jgi:Predicted permeases
MVLGLAVGHELWRAFSFALGMTWEVLWALILGFALSAAVQAVVSKREMLRLMPDDSPKTLLVATGLGAASSSCSYASVALARSLFRKGANFTAAMVFEIASTNLVIELGIIMWCSWAGSSCSASSSAAADDRPDRGAVPALPQAAARR